MLKKIVGSGLIYAGFLGGSLAACAAESMDALTLFAAIAGCGISLLGGVALRGDARHG